MATITYPAAVQSAAAPSIIGIYARRIANALIASRARAAEHALRRHDAVRGDLACRYSHTTASVN